MKRSLKLITATVALAVVAIPTSMASSNASSATTATATPAAVPAKPIIKRGGNTKAIIGLNDPATKRALASKRPVDWYTVAKSQRWCMITSGDLETALSTYIQRKIARNGTKQQRVVLDYTVSDTDMFPAVRQANIARIGGTIASQSKKRNSPVTKIGTWQKEGGHFEGKNYYMLRNAPNSFDLYWASADWFYHNGLQKLVGSTFRCETNGKVSSF